MGLLVDGVWHDKWYDTKTTGGHFKRSVSQMRNCITADGSPGPSGRGGFKAESGRYHLYVSLACPWAHRTLIFRQLKGLAEHISVSTVHWHMAEQGWPFDDEHPDHLYGSEFLHQIYTRADAKYSGRVTVPILWDKEHNTMVSNESSEIIRMLNSAFNAMTGNERDYRPKELWAEIDVINERVYSDVNNGVYKSGFATTQEAYLSCVKKLFSALDWLESLLHERRYLCGDVLTEADWRLFTTLVRFDAVYHGHFKCNKKRIVDYPNLWAYTRELYQMESIAQTVDMTHITHHYYGSHPTINPTGVVPIGPDLDWMAPHGR